MQFQATTDICLQEYLFVEMVMNPDWVEIQKGNVCYIVLVFVLACFC